MKEPKIKRKAASPYRRGNSASYRELQAKSVASRISRHFQVEFVRQPSALRPWRKRDTDAGWDICSYESVILYAGQQTTVRTGVHVCCPPGYFYLIMGRSSLNHQGLSIALNPIDATYTGELLVEIANHGSQNFPLREGDRIAQLVFFPILHPSFAEVEKFTLGKNTRGSKGFGSSGR